jgi:hypothetical protein
VIGVPSATFSPRSNSDSGTVCSSINHSVDPGELRRSTGSLSSSVPPPYGFASVAFSVPFPMVGKLSVGDGFSRRDGRSEALQDGAGEMSCSRRFRLFSKNRSRG